MNLQIDSTALFNGLESAMLDFNAFEAGSLVTLPALPATLGNEKATITIAFQKKAAGAPAAASTLTALNMTTLLGAIGALYADYNTFVAGKAVSLPPIDHVFGTVAIEIILTIQRTS